MIKISAILFVLFVVVYCDVDGAWRCGNIPSYGDLSEGPRTHLSTFDPETIPYFETYGSHRITPSILPYGQQGRCYTDEYKSLYAEARVNDRYLSTDESKGFSVILKKAHCYNSSSPTGYTEGILMMDSYNIMHSVKYDYTSPRCCFNAYGNASASSSYPDDYQSGRRVTQSMCVVSWDDQSTSQQHYTLVYWPCDEVELDPSFHYDYVLVSKQTVYNYTEYGWLWEQYCSYMACCDANFQDECKQATPEDCFINGQQLIPSTCTKQFWDITVTKNHNHVEDKKLGWNIEYNGCYDDFYPNITSSSDNTMSDTSSSSTESSASRSTSRSTSRSSSTSSSGSSSGETSEDTSVVDSSTSVDSSEANGSYGVLYLFSVVFELVILSIVC